MLAALLVVRSSVAGQWHADAGCRWTELEVPAQGKTGFTLVPAAASGLAFTNTLDELNGAANRVLLGGSGVAAGDYDGDGLPDLFFCNLSGANALFKNLGGFRFKNVTGEAGLGTPCPRTRGAVFADVNGDGWLDLLLSVTGRGVLCLLNDGRGRFQDATASAGTGSKFGSQTLALADVDGNGTLDLYIANNRPDDIRDRGWVNVSMVGGHPTVAGVETNRFVMLHGRLEECGQADQLLLNDGAGHFTPVSWTDGTFLDEAGQKLAEPPRDWGLTATFRDVNDDLAPDLYVCNDYWTADRFWLNDGHGHFRAIAPLALRKITASSMSVDFADFDRDGHLDFFVVDMLSRFPHLRKRQSYAQMLRPTPIGAGDDRPQVMRNTLFLNRQDGTFAEIAYYANLPASDWSWAPVFVDVDLDGYEDLLIGSGYFRDVQDYDAEALIRARQHPWTGFPNEAERQKAFTRELREHYRLYPTLLMPIVTFRNLGNCTFQETTEVWGLSEPGVHQGLALADLDGDGDLDLAVNNLNGGAAIYRNETAAPRLAVRLKGKAPNGQGIGAKVALLDGALPRQTTETVCGGHYQSGFDPEAVFAVGRASGQMTIEVRWRNGSVSVVKGVHPNRRYEIDETGSEPAPLPARSKITPMFADASNLIAHRHLETEFDDYERQPLLPFKLSQLGPGAAWYDLDGDGHDELIIGTGRGGGLAVYRTDGRGGFTRVGSDQNLKVPNDTAGLVGWRDGTGTRRLLAGLTGYEAKGDYAALSFHCAGDTLLPDNPLAPEMAGSGALALGDLNGDGRLALFIAGGVVPGQYPVGARSMLYRDEGGQWKPDTRNSATLDHLGIVNAAVWTDLDGNGVPELVLACEWGPLRVFRNRSGLLFEVTTDLGLAPYTGWWRGVTAGDLNNDGRMDLIVANWGLNSPYRASLEQPLVFAYGQLAQPGVMDIIETEYEGGQLVPRRQFMAMADSLPFLHELFASHKAYSEATLAQTLGDRAVLSRRVTAATLASIAFLNTGNGFKPVELPREAQFAPAFSVNVADFDGDGNEDVFLSQNFFDAQPETARLDAGLGLWLQGDGTGRLVAVSSARSGIRATGEQRGAALGDYDEDGRIDLVLAQNGAQTKLYHNTGATPGLRVNLVGPPGNPQAIGAVLRLQFQNRQGPAREIHAGSGYWSQDSLTPVLATPTPPLALWVRWPGGRVTTTPVPANAKAITVNAAGTLAPDAPAGRPAR
jgi:hypothetical protein